jgi:hypothetical protein
MGAFSELQARRACACRLTPDRALESLDEAEEFLRDRGLLTRTPDSSLPSLFGACHEEPYAPGSGGFGEWPRTKYRWSFELADREGVYALQIHRGKTLYLTAETAALVDPVCRAELARMEEADPGWARLLRHLADAGPSLAEDVRVELGLSPPELRSLRSPLERCGALVSRPLVLETAGGGHEHTTELARWDHVFPEPAEDGGLEDLVTAGVRAAIVVPEREPARWFSWRWRGDAELVDRLVNEGRLERPEQGWIAVPRAT